MTVTARWSAVAADRSLMARAARRAADRRLPSAAVPPTVSTRYGALANNINVTRLGKPCRQTKWAQSSACGADSEQTQHRPPVIAPRPTSRPRLKPKPAANGQPPPRGLPAQAARAKTSGGGAGVSVATSLVAYTRILILAQSPNQAFIRQRGDGSIRSPKAKPFCVVT